VLVKLPDVPVIVNVTVPGAAVELAVNVRVLLVVAGFGLKTAGLRSLQWFDEWFAKAKD